MENRYISLDGWRGISIILVILGHWFPLGPKAWHMNETIAATGMAIFFILSGFLITNLLLKDQCIISFLIRRLARIIPLAWLVLLFILFFSNANLHQWMSNLFFYANWPPMGLVDAGSHFWSLSVEIQFYFSIALLVFMLKKKAFILLPFLCLVITGYRIFNEVPIAINTYYRVDEILAGCILALIFNRGLNNIKSFLGKLNTPVLLLLLIASAHPALEYLNYTRPYIALLLVASTLFSSKEQLINQLLAIKPLIYIATISYAVYVFHGALASTWLGSGDTIEKYAKRPLLLLITWLLAHMSTFYYEKYWVTKGKELSLKITNNQK